MLPLEAGQQRRRARLEEKAAQGVTAALFLNDGVTLATAGAVRQQQCFRRPVLL